MSADWPILTLGDVCEKITDGAHNSPKSVEFGKSMASVKDLTRFGVDLSEARFISEEEFEKLVKQGCQPEVGDVLIAKDGNSALDTVCTVDEPLNAVMLSSVAILRPDKNKLDSDFLKYYFCSKQVIDYLKGNFISGAAIPRVVLKDFRKAEIKVPQLETQREISKKLRALDDKIELNHQTNQTLEQIAQAIFKSWFVDFEPTRAKTIAKQKGGNTLAQSLAEQAVICGAITLEQLQALEVDDRGLEGQLHPLITNKSPNQIAGLDDWTPDTLQTTADLFPNALVESELGEVPEGWSVSGLGSCIDILNGFAFKSGDYVEEGTFVLRTKNFNNNVVGRLSDDVFLPDEFLTTHEKYLCKPFDYHLIMVGASVGNRGLIYPHHLPALRNQNMWCFRKKDKSYLSQTYVKFMLDSIVERSMGLASGSAREFFRKGDFGRQAICIGNEAIQAIFSDTVFSLMEKQAQLSDEVQILENTRDVLLPKLLSGELATTAIPEGNHV